MKTQTGFTLIEVAIVVVMIAIMTLIAFPVSKNSSSTSFGINGITETRCIEGYKFVVGHDGGARQMLDEQGKGVRCNN